MLNRTKSFVWHEGIGKEMFRNWIDGQATKGSRWIPRHTEAMKDVVTCDKSRGAGNTL